MRQVKFHQLVISPVYGNCGPGDIVRCDDLFAQHVVDDLKCAVYVDVPQVQAAQSVAVEAVEQLAPPRRGRPRKGQK